MSTRSTTRIWIAGFNYFSVPAGCGIGSAGNLGFHAPLNHPGIADDGTAGNAGYSNAPWTIAIGDRECVLVHGNLCPEPERECVALGYFV